MTQVCLSGHDGPGSDDELLEAAVSSALEEAVVLVEVERVRVGSFLSVDSRGVGGADFCAAEVCEVRPLWAKSKAVPGVFGVLFADPKEANAPEPSPKAEEPPVVGEARPEDVNGETPLQWCSMLRSTFHMYVQASCQRQPLFGNWH